MRIEEIIITAVLCAILAGGLLLIGLAFTRFFDDIN